MIARFPGRCACGCGRPFPAGEEVQRAPAGWIRAACRAPAAPPAPASGSTAEVLDVLERARRVAARVAAETKGGRR